MTLYQTMIVAWSILFLAPSSSWAQSIVAAVLPSSRSVQVGTVATAFATIVNTGSVTATNCGISLVTAIPVTFSFQTTNPLTNQVTGSPNTPVSIPPGAAQSFVFDLRPILIFPLAPTDVQFGFDCSNTNPAPVNTGLNTLLFSASSTLVSDIVVLAATPTNDGIVNVSGSNGGAFAVATVNMGASGSITASADTGNASLPLNISLCRTNPVTGQCISAIGSSVTTINVNTTPTFGIFVQGAGNVPFDPAANRIFVRFKDSGNVTRGSTSVAVRTQ